MNATKSIQADVFNEFHPNSKVWVYASNRILTDDETEDISEQIANFTSQWVSHNVALKAAGTVLYNRFIVLAADDSVNNPGGCSIDESIHFIQAIESHYGLTLFDRLILFYQSNDEIKSFHFNDLIFKIKSGEIAPDTKIYDTTVTQLGQIKNEFIKEADKSWLSKFF